MTKKIINFKIQNLNKLLLLVFNCYSFVTCFLVSCILKRHIGRINCYHNSSGSIIVVFVIVLSVLTTAVLAVSSLTLSNKVGVERTYQKSIALNIAEAGINKALWELKQGYSYTGETGNASISGGEFDVTVTNIDSTSKYIIATAYVPTKASPKYKKAIKVKIAAEDRTSGPFSFSYGAQIGDLGLHMSNNAKIMGGGGASGNVYSAGSITGGNGAEITGDAFVSGSANRIYNMRIGHDAHAHTIQSSRISHDAYYFSSSTLISSTVYGTKYPGSSDPNNIDLPLSSQTIDEWKSLAEEGGVRGNYTLSGGQQGTLGPVKINGNIALSNYAILTLTGPIWVTGAVSISNGAIIKLDPSYSSAGGVLVADGKIHVSNGAALQGSGDPKSFMMLLSLDNGSTTSNPAILASNNSQAAIYYAPNGMIEIANNARLKSVTGRGLHISNNAQVQYDSGLASTEFYDGPGGEWEIKEWQEVRAP